MLGWLRRKAPRKVHPESVQILCEQRLELMLQDAESKPSQLAQAYANKINNTPFPSLGEMVDQWKEPLTDELREGSSWRALMNCDVNLVIRWRDYFYPKVNQALQAPDKSTQRLALRGVLLDSGYARARSRAFLKKGTNYQDWRDLAERSVLAAQWDADFGGVAQVTNEHLASVAVHECTIEMVRFIQRRGLDDATLADYFALWDTVCGQLWNGLAETAIAQANGGFYPLEPMLPLIRQTVDRRRADILAGANFDWDRENNEQEISPNTPSI